MGKIDLGHLDANVHTFRCLTALAFRNCDKLLNLGRFNKFLIRTTHSRPRSARGQALSRGPLTIRPTAPRGLLGVGTRSNSNLLSFSYIAILDNISEENSTKILVTCWTIWHARTKSIYKRNFLGNYYDRQSNYQWFSSANRIYYKNGKNNTPNIRVCKWIPSERGLQKLNVMHLSVEQGPKKQLVWCVEMITGAL